MGRGIQENFYDFSGGLNLVDTINDSNNYLIKADNILVKDGSITNREGILKLDNLLGTKYCILREGVSAENPSNDSILGYYTLNSLDGVNITKATIDTQNTPTTLNEQDGTWYKTKPNIRDVHILWDRRLMSEYGVAPILNHKDMGNATEQDGGVDFRDVRKVVLNASSGDMVQIHIVNSIGEERIFYYLAIDFRENVDVFYLRNLILGNFLLPVSEKEYTARIVETFNPDENTEHVFEYSDNFPSPSILGGVVTVNDCNALGIPHSFAMSNKPRPSSAIYADNEVYNYRNDYADFFILYNVPEAVVMSPYEILKNGYRVLFSTGYYGFNRITYNPQFQGSDKRKMKPFKTIYDTLSVKGENFLATDQGIVAITSEVMEHPTLLEEYTRGIYRSVGDIVAADTSAIDNYTRVLIESGTFRIKNTAISGSVSLATQNDTDGTQAKMVSPIIDSDEYSQWIIGEQSDNSYKIKNLKTSKYLEAGTDNKVIQKASANTLKQRWYLEINGNNEYRIVSAENSRVLNIENDSLITVQEYDPSGNKQRFKLSNVSSPDEGDYTPDGSSFTRFNKVFCRGMFLYKDSIVLYGQPDNRNIIYFSNPVAGITDITDFDDVKLFPATSVDNIETSTSGYVTSLTTFEGDLIIFKTDAIIRHIGALGSMESERKTLPTSIGTFSPNSCLIADNIVVYLTKDGLKMIQTMTEGNVKVQDISTAIKSVFEDIYYTLERKYPDSDFIDRYTEVGLFYYDNYIFMKWKGTIYRFSVKDSNWVTMSPFKDSDVLVTDPYNFYVFSDRGVGKLQYNHYSDYGSPIKWVAETCNFFMQKPSEIKKFKKLFLVSRDYLNFKTGYAFMTVKVDSAELGDYLIDSAQSGVFDAIRSTSLLRREGVPPTEDARAFDYSKWDMDKVAINVLKVRKKGTKFSILLKNNNSYGRFYLYGISANYIDKKPVKRTKVPKADYADNLVRDMYVDYTYYTNEELQNYTYEELKGGKPNG